MQTAHTLNVKLSRAVWLTVTAILLAGLAFAFAPMQPVAAARQALVARLKGATAVEKKAASVTPVAAAVPGAVITMTPNLTPQACDITSVSIINVGSCNNNGTSDPNDDFFTADVAVTFVNQPATGNLQIEPGGDALGTNSVAVSSLVGNSHTFTGVMLKADGTQTVIEVEFTVPANQCVQTQTGPTVQPCSPVCDITSVSFQNIQSCNNNGTSDPGDDFFIADVAVTFANQPATGNLQIEPGGDALGTNAVPVANLVGNSHTFTGVMLKADGTQTVIEVEFTVPANQCTQTQTGPTVQPCSTPPPPCAITCPANITVSNDANQCGAVVNYPAPTTTGTCGTVTCSPASGSFFPKGTTTITCTATAGPTCSFTVTVNDNQPPSITCPANIFTGTTGNSANVSFTTTATDNCPGVTVACTPASGSSFNVGVTTVTCTATDASGNTATCSFTVTVNRVSFSVSDPLACTGPGNAVTANFSITNNGNVSVAVSAVVALPAALPAVPGSCTTNVGTCTINNPTNISLSATLAPGQTANVSYLAQVGDVASGTQLCSLLSVSFAGGPLFQVQACVTVTCPPLGPGAIFPSGSEASDQGAGSVLIYNIYTSGATSGNTQNTGVNITNVHPTLPAFVHLFLVSEGCSVADSYVCLTPNQTSRFIMYDYDPGITGYIVAVATDSRGCPINFNYLIGDEYVKFSTGHAANLGAEAISAIAGGLPACDGSSVTSQLDFNGIAYDRVSHVLALDNIGSRADGNDTLLILNRIGGNLGTGAGSLSSVFGIFYDDAENALSFTFNGGHQFRSSLSNNFPRLTPRFETFIPAGRTGWFKLWPTTGLWGMTGAAINFNPNAAASAGAFNQGHNLHKLRLTNTANYVIPIFPPSC